MSISPKNKLEKRNNQIGDNNSGVILLEFTKEKNVNGDDVFIYLFLVQTRIVGNKRVSNLERYIRYLKSNEVQLHEYRDTKIIHLCIGGKLGGQLKTSDEAQEYVLYKLELSFKDPNYKRFPVSVLIHPELLSFN